MGSTFGTESAVRKRGGSRNLPYLNTANQTVDKALLLQGFAIVGTAFLI